MSYQDPYTVGQMPNIAGAGNYASMLQSAIGGLGKPQQAKPAQPGVQAPGVGQAQQPGTVAGPTQQQNYIQQLLKSLFGGGQGAQ